MWELGVGGNDGQHTHQAAMVERRATIPSRSTTGRVAASHRGM